MVNPKEEIDPRAKAALAHAMGVEVEHHAALAEPLPEFYREQIRKQCEEELRIGMLSGWRISRG